MNRWIPSLVSLLLLAPVAWGQQSDAEPEASATETTQSSQPITDRLVVTADFRGVALTDLGASVTVIDEQAIEEQNATHLEDILSLVPNVNFATGASRGRFFQIRGIGARSQFVEPANASVGILIDGIDLTGLGGAATTLDIEQVEVLRGPQGTLFGANALAGMIHLVTGDPTSTLERKGRMVIGNHASRYVEGVVSGPMNEQLGYRLAAATTKSDGHQKNRFLGVRDTQGVDETTVRGKLRWIATDDLTIDWTALHLDIDNGYDAFSLDNTRTTLSDEPGFDRQQTWAGAMQVDWQANDQWRVEAALSHVDADLDYGYDEDWAFDAICEVFECIFGGYTSFDRYVRNTSNTTADVRLVSNTPADQAGWVVGLYHRDQDQALERFYTYSSDFVSDYGTQNQAIYGQVNFPFAANWQLKAGLRLESFEADYSDNEGGRYDQDETLWGGQVSIERAMGPNRLVYGLISRGYKAGGINPDADVPESERRYQTETLINYELGIKTQLRDGDIQFRAAAFYQDRADIQTQQSLVVPVAGDQCPCEFIEFQSNAAAGTGYGLEAEAQWQVSSRFQAFSSIGLLQARFDDFVSFSHVDSDEEMGMGVDLSRRDVPQAPNYMAVLGGVAQLTERWSLKGEMEIKDGFFFSSRHDTRANAYEMFHLRLSYMADDWDFALWVKNLTNERSKTRGFGGFGNDPRKGYATEPYFQFGAPRTFGIHAGLRF